MPPQLLPLRHHHQDLAPAITIPIPQATLPLAMFDFMAVRWNTAAPGIAHDAPKAPKATPGAQKLPEITDGSVPTETEWS